MKDRPLDGISRRSWRRAAASLAAVLCLGACAGAAENELIRATAAISGQQINAFTDGAERVTVVLGDFVLKVGARRLSGRDAVLWIADESVGQVQRHRITAYVEGEARLQQPDGSVVSNPVMLLTLAVQGRLAVAGPLTEEPLADFPLYLRAGKARQEGLAAPGAAETPIEEPLPHAAPELIRLKGPPGETGETPTSPGPQAPEKPAGPAAQPTRQPVLPVRFYAEEVTLQEQDGQRVVIARGSVYLCQGSPDSDLFLEMRSQAAVVFIERRPPGEKDSRSPLSPKLTGREETPGAGVETVSAVYLEGDVILARGERSLRGEQAFHDFTTDRAIVPHPVFRTIQKQRNIPIYIRAEEARALSARELWFRKAHVTTSDFYTPGWALSARTAYLMDKTEYDEKGVAISEPGWNAKLRHATYDVDGVPIFYLPRIQGDFTEGNLPLRRFQVGTHGRFGFGVETEWYLFRMLGLLEPKGFKGRFELDWYERGVMAGVDLKYARGSADRQYSGYWMLHGLLDRDQEDDFGDERKGIAASQARGRILARHKEILPQNWTVQLELSYICDRNFLEEFFPSEYYAGKEQETLLYAKKQQDNWAFTTLAKYRLNRFDSQGEAAPDLGFHLIGQPVAPNLLLYSETHAGVVRWHPANDSGQTTSNLFGRFDTREELNFPQHFGPVNVVPYATVRGTAWGDEPEEGGDSSRPYGQVGVKADTHFWRVYEEPRSRLWDIHRLRHILTPEATAFVSSAGGVEPENLFPLDPDIEQHLGRVNGGSIGVDQRLQTQRGRAGEMHSVDWMRLSVVAGFYDSDLEPNLPADGRFFLYRPEYSLPRDHVNVDYAWNLSDATLFLADANYDVETSAFRRANAGFAVSRDPRLRYYLGIRWIKDLDSAVGTLGVDYALSRKYSLNFFQQYDFQFEDGQNLATSLSLTRKLPRWYVALGFVYDASLDDVGLVVTIWPEGIPEVRVGGERLSVLGRSEKN